MQHTRTHTNTFTPKDKTRDKKNLLIFLKSKSVYNHKLPGVLFFFLSHSRFVFVRCEFYC